MEALHELYPLTSLQIGDIQSYSSRIFLYSAPTSHKLLILVDNRPWLTHKNRKSIQLWQLMVTKYRISPFMNTRTLTTSPNRRSNTPRTGCLNSNSNFTKNLYKWFSAIDAARWQENYLFSVMDLYKSLHGFIVFEVAWKDVHGINYLSELQTDASVALEVKSMRKWEFNSINQALSCISFWFSGTSSETNLFQYNLNRLSDMDGPSRRHQDLSVASKELLLNNASILEASSGDIFFDAQEDPFELNNQTNNMELHSKEKALLKLLDRKLESSICSTQYRDTLLLFRFNNSHLPSKLRQIITSDLRLLTLLESGLPGWVIFFQSYPIFCHFYRPWMRPLARSFYILISLVTVMIGFYDLYKNVPLLKATASSLMGPLFDWMEAWEMISRVRYLGTMLFLQNFEKAIRWLMMVLRVLRSVVSLVTKPLIEPLMDVVDFISPVWNIFTETGDLYFSTIWDVIKSSYSSIVQLLEVLLYPFGLIYEFIETIVVSVCPILCSIWELFLVPIRLLLGVASYLGSVFSEAYVLLKNVGHSISSVVQAASISEMKPTGYGISAWKSISKDLVSQVFGATKSVVHGFVAFFTTCNRHRLSIYNHMRIFFHWLASILRLSSYSCPCQQIQRIEYRPVADVKGCDRCK